MARATHETLVKKALSKPGVKAEYDNLAEEFALLEELVKARFHSGKTQEEVAKAMKTSTSVVGRLESGGGCYKHSPTLATLQRYARAINCKLKISLVPYK